jgi:hypothetical protein
LGVTGHTVGEESLDTLENILRFLNSYPTWAKVLALGGLVLTTATLVFTPRTAGDAQAQPKATQAGAVLRILGVNLFPDDPNAFVRVTAFVNGTSFRYPSLAGIEWLQVGPSMSLQAFPLPKAEKYELRFEMDLKSQRPGATGEFVSQQTVTIAKLPTIGEYNLHRKQQQPGVGITRSASVNAAVRYAVEPAP